MAIVKQLIPFIIFAEICLIVNAGIHWGYPDRETNATDSKWGGMCDNGKKQSPIDLRLTESFRGIFRHFIFYNYDKTLKGTIISNTGHSVQINSPEDRQYKISGGGLPSVYIFEQMHWHWWSEHKIDGIRYPLEVHLVNRNEIYPNMSVAVQHRYGVSVLAVLFHITEKRNKALANVLSNIDNLDDDVGKTIALYNDVKPQDFLPSDKSKYFRYEGSLTTPGCDESVLWTVFEDTIPLTLEQVEKFTQIKDNSGHFLKSNYRSIQSANNRAVTYIADNNIKIENSSSSLVPTLLTFIISTILHLTVKKSSHLLS